MSEDQAKVVESSVVEVTAKKDEKEATISFDFGKNLKEATALFGDDAVFGAYVAQGKIALQAVMRRYLAAGKDCQELLTLWKPGVTLERIIDKKAAAINTFAQMTPEDKAKFIAELKANM